MELIDIGFGVATMLAGGAISWLASWYYYFKSRPHQTAVDALARAAIKAAQDAKRGLPEHSTDIPLEVALEIIKAFEQHRLYFTELTICARTYRFVGDVLKETLESTEAAGASAGPMLSQSWIAARDKALKEGLAKAKENIRQQLKRNAGNAP